MTDLHPRLARLAREQHGLLTRRQATAAQVAPAVLDAALRSGALRRVRPGLFVQETSWAATARHDRYALVVRGVLLDRTRWIASHHAALALHGLPLHDVDRDLVDVAAPVGTSKRRPGLHVHVATAAQRLLIDDPTVQAVGVADACVLAAVGSGFEAGVVAMDAALHRRLVTVESLDESLDGCGLRYGVGQARAAIDAAESRCESPGETRTRLVLRAAGLTIRSQVSLSDEDGFIGRVDLLVGDRVVVEFDGAVKYDGLDGRRALMDEKRREERLRDAGFRVVRVTWSDLSRPGQLVARVRSLLPA